jgi:DNA-binding response OmpR family regulator
LDRVNVLLADDDPVARATLEAVLGSQGHAVTAVGDGAEALATWDLFRFDVLLSDWEMPGLDGLTLCRRLRERRGERYPYIILATGRATRDDYVAGMDAGADDFLTKPVDPHDLRIRLRVAERILTLKREVSTLQGILPTCAYCKRIREGDTWVAIERYVEKRSGAEFSHGVCPDCYAKHLADQLGPA